VRAHVDALCHRYRGAEATEYTRAVSIAFLLGAVARVMRPGCQVDTMPILEG
jgi:predicted P-loop ATPase